MTTPSETRAGKLLRIVSEMRQYMSGRGNAPPPCVMDWANRLEALAASEPGEAVGVVDGTEGGCKYVRPLFSSEHMPPVGTKLYTHPAPEQPGKGEAAHQANESTLDRVIQAVSFDEHGKRHYVFGAQARARVAAALIPQPSDPAEGDALRALIADWRERAKNGPGALNVAAKELEAALSTPPTAAVSVDMGDLLFVGFDANSEHRLFRMRKTAERHCIGEIKTYAALTAALDPQVKR